MVTMLLLVLTMLPTSTPRRPVIPSIGARMRVYCNCTCAARIAASLAATAASYCATWLRCVSRSVLATYWR